jgi:branched-chain amino acid transport system permease protein
VADIEGDAPVRVRSGRGRGALAALRSRTGLGVALVLVLAAFWLLGAARGASLASLLSLTVWGVMLGGIVALGAIGLTLVYGVLRFPNFAHGELVTVGAYAAFTPS